MALQAVIPHRPAAIYPPTGMMTTDGIFVVNMGDQIVRAVIRNDGQDTLSNLRVYVEGFADPGISQSGDVRLVDQLAPGASIGLGFRSDFRYATPGETPVSFIVESDGQPPIRIIKKIFVTRVDYHKPTRTYSVVLPQGTMRVVFHRAIVGPGDYGEEEERRRAPFFALPTEVTYDWVPAAPYAGVRGPYPFEDPLWKIILGILAGLIAAGAALYDYFSDGTLNGGKVSVSGTFEETEPSVCCATVKTEAAASSSTDHVASALYSAAGAVATVAIASDGEDPHYRGQAATVPGPGEKTISESVRLKIDYTQPPNPGQAFQIAGEWTYTRTTDQQVYTYSATDQRQNQHVASSRTIEAPQEHDRSDGPLPVRTRFIRPDGQPYKGGELYVLGVLTSPDGLAFTFELQDHGLDWDQQAADGWYSGAASTGSPDGGPYGGPPSNLEWGSGEPGDWLLFVIAQDVNLAEEGMTPHEAAQFIGGLPITDQLRLQFDDECLLVSDAIIRVS